MGSKTVAWPVRVKAGEADGLSEGMFEAYASTFVREPDSYGEVVLPGAFTETLAEWKASGNTIPVLWGHDFSDPFAYIGSVVEAHEDEHGLRVVGVLDLDNAKAAQVYRLLKGRRVTKMSFAFDVLDASWGEIDDEDVYELRRLRLHEVSIVPIPANPTAEVLAVKDASRALVAGLKEGRVLAAKHIDSLRAAQEAIGSVIAAADGTDQEKASGTPVPKPEEPAGAKGEEVGVVPSARALAQLKLAALIGREGRGL